MAHPVDEYVGRRIRQARCEAGLTQTELANVLGVTFGPIQHYETGRNRVSASALYAIAQATSRQPGWFFEGFDQ